MSQFEIPGAPSLPSDQPAFESSKTSGLAISSLICSLICCLPFTTIPGILLGAVALLSIGKNPALRGRGLAIAGILLGVLFTSGQFGVYEVYRFYSEIIRTLPQQALAAGFAGDIAGFKGSFHGSGATASDAEAQAFVDALQRRYGNFVDARWEMESRPRKAQQVGQPIVPFAYVITFEKGSVSADGEIAFSDPQRGGFVNKLASITIYDQALGDLTFPPSEGGATGGEAQPAPATAPTLDEDEPGGGE